MRLPLQKRQIITLIIGILMALATLLMLKSYIEQQRQEALKEAREEIGNLKKNIPVDSVNQVSILVAKSDIAKGAVITQENLAAAAVPAQFVQSQAINSAAFGKIAGMTVAVPIARGDQITLSKLAIPEREEGITRSLAMSTPAGKRAINVSVDEISSVSEMIKPGDYVDVIAILLMPQKALQKPADTKQSAQTEIIPLFQNILVLAVGQEANKSVSSKGPSLITLALGPKEANLIAFVQEQGKIRLNLRSPADANIADADIEGIEPANWETLFQYIRPAQEKAQKKAAQQTKQQPEIEIYRGLNKEKITLSE